MTQTKCLLVAQSASISKKQFLPFAAWPAVVLLLLASFFVAVSADAKQGPNGFSKLVKELTPMVVNISTTQIIKRDKGRQQEMPKFPPGSPFEEFFREFMPRQGQGQGQGQPRRPRKATSLGSGFIISPDGYIVTNNHVIMGADEVTVILHNDVNLKAKIVGRDPKTDLALLKVETKKPLPAVRWGDSDAAEVGDWIIAIGNPFGLGGTVTTGIISARARVIQAGPYDDFIQTDASINRGNSGGPMFNMKGQVIGINSVILSPSGGNIGIGFAIPSSLAEPVVAQLKKYGHTRRGWLGIHIQEVTPEIAESLGMGRARGAMVASVVEGSPAEKAKLEPGDVILRFGDTEIGKPRKLSRTVAETTVGKKVSLEIWRKGRKKKVKIEIALMEEGKTAETGDVPLEEESASEHATVLGLSLASINAETRRKFNLSRDVKGVAIVGVDEDSEAMEKGIRPGDIVVLVGQDHESVSMPADIIAKVEKAEKSGQKFFLLQIARGGGQLLFVTLRMAKDG